MITPEGVTLKCKSTKLTMAPVSHLHLGLSILRAPRPIKTQELLLTWPSSTQTRRRKSFTKSCRLKLTQIRSVVGRAVEWPELLLQPLNRATSFSFRKWTMHKTSKTRYGRRMHMNFTVPITMIIRLAYPESNSNKFSRRRC